MKNATSREIWPNVRAAGTLIFAADTGRVLLLDRTDEGGWCQPGGHREPGESAWETARRELEEETGLAFTGEPADVFPVETPEGWDYAVFVVMVGAEAPPVLNFEHRAFVWADPDDVGPHLHPGTAVALDFLRRNR